MKRGELIPKTLFIFIILILILLIIRTPVQETEGEGILANLKSAFSLAWLSELYEDGELYGLECSSDSDCPICAVCNTETGKCQQKLDTCLYFDPIGKKCYPASCGNVCFECNIITGKCDIPTEGCEPETCTNCQNRYTCQDNNIMVEGAYCSNGECLYAGPVLLQQCGSCATCKIPSIYSPTYNTISEEEAYATEKPDSAILRNAITFADQFNPSIFQNAVLTQVSKRIPILAPAVALAQAGQMGVTQVATTAAKQQINYDNCVLIDFYADWCIPCKKMDPIIEELVGRGYPTTNINSDNNPELIQKYKVDVLPTFVLVRLTKTGAKELGRITGPTTLDKLEKLFTSHSKDCSKPPIQPPTPPTPDEKVQSCSNPPQSDETPCVCPGENQQYISSDGQTNPGEINSVSVRLKIQDPDGNSFGTGTIIDSRNGDSLIITCGHIFRDSQGRGQIQIDILGQDGNTIQTVRGSLLRYDLENQADIALVSISTQVNQVARVASAGTQVQRGNSIYSAGCAHGGACTTFQTNINSVDRFLGPSNFQTAGHQIEGRSGAGAFNERGELIGILNNNDPMGTPNNPNDDEGIFAGLTEILRVLDEQNLAWIYNSQQPPSSTKQCHCQNQKCVEKKEEPPEEPEEPPTEPVEPVQPPEEPVEPIDYEEPTEDEKCTLIYYSQDSDYKLIMSIATNKIDYTEAQKLLQDSDSTLAPVLPSPTFILKKGDEVILTNYRNPSITLDDIKEKIKTDCWPAKKPQCIPIQPAPEGCELVPIEKLPEPECVSYTDCGNKGYTNPKCKKERGMTGKDIYSIIKQEYKCNNGKCEIGDKEMLVKYCVEPNPICQEENEIAECISDKIDPTDEKCTFINEPCIIKKGETTDYKCCSKDLKCENPTAKVEDFFRTTVVLSYLYTDSLGRSRRSTGSGTILRDGIILTATHNLQEHKTQPVSINFHDGSGKVFTSLIAKKVSYFDSKSDLAILEFEKGKIPLAKFPKFIPENYNYPEKDLSVFSFGLNKFGSGSNLYGLIGFSRGFEEVLNENKKNEGTKMVAEFKDNVDKSGRSGGGLYDQCGNFIGVTFAQRVQNRRIMVYSPIDNLRKFF